MADAPLVSDIQPWLVEPLAKLKSLLDLRQQLNDADGSRDSCSSAYLMNIVDGRYEIVSGKVFGKVLRGDILHLDNDISTLTMSTMRILIENNDPLVVDKSKVRNRNTVIYGDDSGMGWHTNSDVPGLRLYLVYNFVSSIFKYYDNKIGTIRRIIEPAGWHAKYFIIPSDKLFWHAIRTNGRRYSIGYKLTD